MASRAGKYIAKEIYAHLVCMEPLEAFISREIGMRAFQQYFAAAIFYSEVIGVEVVRC